MKKHTYSDGSVSYYYQIGDKVKFERDYHGGMLHGLIKKGTIAVIRDIDGAYIDAKSIKHLRAAGIVSFVSVGFLDTYKSKTFWSYTVNVPVWELKPRNTKIAKAASEIPKRIYNKVENTSYGNT